jgi:excisionase family DNA binding protein
MREVILQMKQGGLATGNAAGILDRDDESLITVPQASRFLGVGKSKIYEMMDSGQLVFGKLGGVRRIRMGAVRALAMRHLVGGPDDFQFNENAPRAMPRGEEGDNHTCAVAAALRR